MIRAADDFDFIRRKAQENDPTSMVIVKAERPQIRQAVDGDILMGRQKTEWIWGDQVIRIVPSNVPSTMTGTIYVNTCSP